MPSELTDEAVAELHEWAKRQHRSFRHTNAIAGRRAATTIALIADWRAARAELKALDDEPQGAICPACGVIDAVDEEGCCVTCGRDSMWYGPMQEILRGDIHKLHAERDLLRSERDHARGQYDGALEVIERYRATLASAESERDEARRVADAAHCIGPWRWQGDGGDDLASMSDGMVVTMAAGDLRALLDAAREEVERLRAVADAAINLVNVFTENGVLVDSRTQPTLDAMLALQDATGIVPDDNSLRSGK